MTYDTIIIGSGAGGSAAAYRLVQAGQSVLLLERGEALPLDGSTLDPQQVVEAGAFKSKETWLDKTGRAFIPEEFFNLGGKTKWYGAALLRFGRDEFAAEPSADFLGWPIGYNDLEPYYAEAESLLGVRCFEPEPDLMRLRQRIEQPKSGWHSIPLPLALKPAIMDDDREARHFDGFASVSGFKGDGQQSLLSRVKDSAGLKIICGCRVIELTPQIGNPFRIGGVLLDDGRRFTAESIILAAGALHSPRLLRHYLDGDERTAALPCAFNVGRYFKRHILTAMLAFSPRRKTDAIRKTLLWLNERFPHGSVQPLGFGEDVLTVLMPRILPKRLGRILSGHAYGFFLQTEDGSDLANRVTAANLNYGKSLPKLDYDPERTPMLCAEHRAMVKSFRAALIRAGCIAFTRSIPLTGTAHACGTLATGHNPNYSVVDAKGKVHGIENLYVVDGSILPRSSRVNPALTIYAWALRTADHLSGVSV